MKHSLLFAFVLVLTYCSASHAESNPPWVETTGPSNIKCLAASGDTIFAGDPSGLYFSPDNGTTWVLSGFDSVAIVALAVFDGKVFAGTSGSGLFISTNSGVSWTPDTNGFQGATSINSLVACPPNLVAATSNGISVSTDGGSSWTQESNVSYGTLATDGTNVYATSFVTHAFFASSDRGMSWRGVDSDLYSISSLAVLDGDIFAAGGNGQGVFRSTNGGVNWEQVNEGIDSTLIGFQEFNCHYLLTYGQDLFMGSTFGIYLSTDTGSFWTLETDTLETQPGTGQFFDNTLLVWNEKLWAAAGTLQGLVPGADDSIWVCPLSGLIGFASVNSPQAANASLTAYPNPFTQSTTINFSPSESGLAEVSVVNILGTSVARMFSGQLDPGAHSFTWDASGLAPGMYECILSMNGNVQEIPVMLTR
jgi:hypothetical protein